MSNYANKCNIADEQKRALIIEMKNISYKYHSEDAKFRELLGIKEENIYKLLQHKKNKSLHIQVEDTLYKYVKDKIKNKDEKINPSDLLSKLLLHMRNIIYLREQNEEISIRFNINNEKKHKTAIMLVKIMYKSFVNILSRKIDFLNDYYERKLKYCST